MHKKFNPLKQWFTGIGGIIALVFLTTATKAQSINIAASANPICSGTPVTFTATITGAPTPSFAWYLNGSFTGQEGNTYSNPNLANGNNIVCYMFTGGFNYASNTITMSVASPSNYYLDADGDGFGAGTPITACAAPGSNYVTNNSDCNDANFNIKPTATEIRCNGIDENCNGMADDTGPEIALLGLSQTIPDGSTTVSTANNTDYGNVTTGNVKDHTFQIPNTGSQVLTVTTISSTNSTEFNANQSGYTFPVNIEAGNTLNFVVRYAPSTGGISTTTLTILSNDCDEATYDIKLQGSATLSTTTTVTSSLNPSLTGNNVTFTATVTGNGNPVTLGTVTFKEGPTTLAANVALNSNGQATFSTSALTVGSHDITAFYSGATGFAAGSGMVTQVVNNLPPTLGTYPNKAIDLAGNATVSPDAASANTAYATATTNPVFNGKLEVNPATGVVRITNAHPAGTYTITVTAYGAGGSITRTFPLTVNTAGCTLFTANAFAPALNLGAGDAPSSVAVGDFNGDGRQDLAAANYGSGTVSVLLRKSDNTGFEPKADYGAGSQPVSVAVGDLNGDGYPDLAVANAGSNNISVLLRNSNNTGFETKADYGAGVRPGSVAVGDFNGDGRPDLAVANYGSANVSVLLRSSDNTGFETKADFGVGSGPNSVAVGDFNDDGRPDLAVANYGSNTVSVLERVCCPVLTAQAPAVQVTNSTCGAGCIVGGGSIAAPSGTCPTGSTLQYQLNGGTWSTNLPTYVQTGPVQTVKTRCLCDADPTGVSSESSVTTVHGTVPALNVPANGAATVACPALAAQPAPPVVNSCNGSPITPSGPVITNSPNPLTCEGTRTYTFTYSCGSNTAGWSFVYTIERETFTVPANGAATVACLANATAPTLPTVLSHCGETLTPSAPVITDSPTSLSCEGTRTYAYTFTDCEGNTAVWSFVYTVIDNTYPLITCPASLTVCESTMVTYTPPVGTDNCIGQVTTQIAGLPAGSVFPRGVTTNTFQVTATNSQTAACSFTVTVNPLPTAGISGTTAVCQDASSPGIIFTGASATAPYTFTYKINNGPDLTVTSSGNTAIISVSTATAGTFVYSLVSIKEAGTTQCNQSGTATVSVNTKPTLTLTANGQTLNEGSAAVLCDLDDNPTNILTPNVITGCVAGNAVWRKQIGAGGWSDWSSTAPSTQPSNNTLYRYQAACKASCEVTYSGVISLTINYRASTPQNVSLVADGTTVTAGESKTICNLEGNTITFNASCATGEFLLYSVDGSDYTTGTPSQIVDNNFHNYRLRCRKADGTPSCAETESAPMSLKITTSGVAPVVSITPTDGCGTPTPFSGTSTCGLLTTIWYNATTNQALPTLPTTTPNATTSYYARCQSTDGCLSEKSNTVTFTVVPVNAAPLITASQETLCTGSTVTVSANCPAGSIAFWNTGVTTNSFQVAFSNVTTQTYWAKCIFTNGCQTPESVHKTIFWKAFELNFINIGQSKSAIKPANDRNLWTGQFITPDAGPALENSTEANPTIYHSENVNKTAPRFWTVQVQTCALGTDGSVTYDMLATPEAGVLRSYNTHENNAPYLMYANRDGFTELYVQNHPAYGFYQDNGSGGNVYDEGLPKGLYKLGVRYWDQKGQGSIYPSTRQPAGNVLAYQEYWFRIQSQNGIGTGGARIAADIDPSHRRTAGMTKTFAQVMPNPVANTLHLKISEAKDQKVNVSMVDASGRSLLQRSFIPETNQHQEEFEVSELANGMYFLKVNTADADKQTIIKVVKGQ